PKIFNWLEGSEGRGLSSHLTFYVFVQILYIDFGQTDWSFCGAILIWISVSGKELFFYNSLH
ncbi:hypothetical protein, partial [Salmonella sp. s51944]|uniref:hypothetical protein n=1 Tax=Salmonella sp. s51944 TaxID=3159655 RepID=UPI0039808769